jgi:hypothetical protein
MTGLSLSVLTRLYRPPYGVLSAAAGLELRMIR